MLFPRSLVLAALLAALSPLGVAAAGSSLPVPAQCTASRGEGAYASSQVNLRWKAVPGATSYEVWIQRNGKWVLPEDDPNYTPLTPSTSIANLQPGTQYLFRVRAVGDKGVKSPLTAVLSAQTAAAEISYPSLSVSSPSYNVNSGTTTYTHIGALTAPQGLFGMFPEGDRVRLTWQPVASAARYTVEEEVKGNWQPANDVVGEPAATQVVLLNHGVPGPWRFRVRAVGTDGSFSEPSWAITVDRH